ncbi:MAG TPA: hypothetical protein VKB08_09335, partial [Bradyrhizobium sp.]|nr:hypothetical protein [Bradyrhizobium sp.]
DDRLDLLDITFGANTTASYAASQDGTGGTLTVSDGTHAANIALIGQYSGAGFEITADSQLGSVITYHDQFWHL